MNVLWWNKRSRESSLFETSCCIDCSSSGNFEFLVYKLFGPFMKSKSGTVYSWWMLLSSSILHRYLSVSYSACTSDSNVWACGRNSKVGKNWNESYMEQCFPLLLIIMIYKVVLTFDPLEKICLSGTEWIWKVLSSTPSFATIVILCCTKCSIFCICGWIESLTFSHSNSQTEKRLMLFILFYFILFYCHTE